VFVCVYQIIYDSLVYASYRKNHSCDVLIPAFGLNEFIWFLSRTVSNSVWIVPIVVVFWPWKCSRKPAQAGRHSLNRIADGGTGESGFFEDSDDDASSQDSEFQSQDPNKQKSWG
jgi:hypothetical protein